MEQVQIVRHNLGEASGIGGLVGRRNGITYLIVHPDVTVRGIIDLALELLTPEEMAALRQRKACDLAWCTGSSTPTAA